MGHHLASPITSIFSILISSRRRSTKMKCFIALALLAVVALSYAEEAVYDIVETRERCHPVGPEPLCKKVEDEEHEVVVTKETCRVGTGSTGPLCKKEVLKREKCPPLLSGKSGCKRISQEKRGCKPGPGKPYC